MDPHLLNSSAFRLPTEPYPGLRPFLDHEAMLLLGRSRQVQDVIARLRDTHFVAVIGGSGSGKSSLIRAGVVPELRGFGIPDAGDYWVPIVCTPGTTAKPDETALAAGVMEQTPITRLAWKLSQQLEPAATASDDAERRDEMAAALRMSGGFTRLVRLYSEELPALGPRREQARFLFVIDQFEELFHPNNRGSADARTMVEAVIDHFFNPHERCFVVLTMRSEHLADCAGYLELPDAINKSSYLMRRLDAEELREAIVGPAKYFLRLLQRRADAVQPPQPLPADVVFDDEVIDRLLVDVDAITADPDHLPLLQHALARTWEAARARSAAQGESAEVPARIEWRDLEHAVDPGSTWASGWLRVQSSVNTLRTSLERWAQATYLAHDLDGRRRIDIVLRHLAFKDPNNGQYTQQRLDVADPRLFADTPTPQTLLRSLLEHGFLDSVNYLFWDKENPQRVTLKVSHESFIRGWEHFRMLVDAEADRFEEFISTLRRCARWRVERSPELLLEPAELMRLDEAGLQRVFDQPAERADWFRVLPQYRDGKRLAEVEPDVDRYIAASRDQVAAEESEREQAAQREREAQAREQALQGQARVAQSDAARAKAQRDATRSMALVIAIAFVVLLPLTLFAWLVQIPVLHSVDEFTDARQLVERDHATPGAAGGEAGQRMGKLLEAANLVIRQRYADGAFERHAAMRWFETAFGWALPFTDMRRVYAKTDSDPLVNGTMRALLTTSIWRSATDPSRVDPAQLRANVWNDGPCTVLDATGASATLQGTLYFDPSAQRGIFFTPAASEIAMYVATLDAGACTAGRIVWSVPRYLKPLLLVDAQVRYLAVAQTDAAVVQPAITLYGIVWSRGDDGRTLDAVLRRLSVVADTDAVGVMRAEFDAATPPGSRAVPEVRSVRTWREVGGTGVGVGGQSWRLYAENARPIEVRSADAWKPLTEPAAGSGCARLATLIEKSLQPSFRLQMLQLPNGTRCYAIQRGNPPRTGPGATPGGPGPRDLTRSAGASEATQMLVSVYAMPTADASLDAAPPPSIASWTMFADRSPVDGDWVSATCGPFEGWMALRRRQPDGALQYLAAPWSTAALSRLADEVARISTVPLSRPLPVGPAASSPASAFTACS